MPIVPVKFTVKKLVSGNCNTVTQTQTIELWAIDDSAKRYGPWTTDAAGYIRKSVETGPYNAYVNNGGAPCATCRQLVNATSYNQQVTLCNTCAR